MKTPLASAAASQIVDVLKRRDGRLTRIKLLDGKQLAAYNITWGQDFEDPEYHITSNIGPTPIAPHSIDIFSSRDVRRVVDPSNDQVLYER